MDAGSYPEKLMKYIIRTGLPGRMFSEINYCGYAIWWLSPEYHKLFTDNRFDVFGSKWYVYAATVTDGLERDEALVRQGWGDILNHYGVNFVVLSREALLNKKLRNSAEWEQVYYTDPPDAVRRSGYNVWLRKDPKFAAVAARARANFEAEHPGWPLPEWSQP